MVRVGINYGDQKWVVTDGYLPDFSYYQNKDWGKALDDSLPVSERYREQFKKKIYNKRLKSGRPVPTLNSQANFHKKLIKSLLYRYCPHAEESFRRELYPARGIGSVDGLISRRRKKIRDLVLPVFTREIEKSITEENMNYIFDFAIVDLANQDNLKIFEDCNEIWMNFMGFVEKKADEYIDFNAYEEAAEKLLRKTTESFVHTRDFFSESKIAWLRQTRKEREERLI
ncbi:MAG: hypothetical protein KAS04_03995 [Candidatus Aenigmarchaeota archaeon]|nr:hypothetical protein [Candidatus Aenigmarchaeota archaeon]